MRLILFGLTFVMSLSARADYSLRTTIELDPQYRNLNQDRLSNFDEHYEGYALLNTHFEGSWGPVFLEVKPELRFLVSRGVQDKILSPDYVTVKTSKRVLNSNRTLFHEADAEGYFDFDRLNLRYNFDNGEIYAGRRPLTLGVLRFFPIWNKLTLPLIFEPGPEWIENPDVAGFYFQVDSFSFRVFGSRGGEQTFGLRDSEPTRDDLVLAEARYFGKGFELQFLGGTWWEHAAAGLAGSVDIYDNTFRLESLWISARKDEVAQGQVGLGLETALTSKLTVVSEILYQSAGLDEVKNIGAPPNRFMTLAGKYYALPYMTYQVHPLWSLQGGALVGIMEESTAIGLAGFERSLGDNTTLTLKIKYPFGAPSGEFGSERVADPFGRKLGLASSVLLKFQTVF